MSAPATTSAPYRPEIQGLRAVAALLVASYHIWFARVSGGVDVFIVVSAFLITTSLLRQVETGGRVHFGAFWGNLVKRLVPAAYCVIIAVTIASILWLPRQRWIATIGDIVASALYVENWLLAFRSVDYLAQSATTSPLQHYWALSVQGQLYLLWPMLVALFIGIAAFTRARFRRVAFIGFATVFTVSLAYSVFATRANQPFAYFNTFARAWEFSLGALFAVALPFINLSRRQRIVAGWVGLLAIVSCGIVLQVSRVFPGYAALWPTMSAMMILAAGTSGSRFGADRLLSLPVLTSLGDKSYSLYLWHWPVYIFFRQITDQQSLGLLDGLMVIAISIALATLTTRYIENPSRRSKGKVSGSPLVVGATWATPLLVLVTVWTLYAVRAKRIDGRIIDAGDPNYPGAAVMEPSSGSTVAANVPIHPGPLAIKSDRPSALQGRCLQNLHESAPVSCIFGAADATRVIALVGGSHSAHWVPALERFAKENNWKIVTYTKNRCLLSTDLRVVFGGAYVSCQQWNENVMRELLRIRPQIVFTTATIGSGIDEVVPPGFVNQWRKLTAAGIDVVAIRSTPRFPFDVPDCVARNGPLSEACRPPRSAVLSRTSPTDTLVGKLPRVHFIDLSRYFCDARACPPVIGNLLVYSDDSHITTHFARTLAPMLQRELSKVAADLPQGPDAGAQGRAPQ